MTSTAALRDLIRDQMPSLVAFRRDLHAHPELGYEEHRTSRVIQAQLAQLGVKFVANLAGGTGVVAHLPATDPSRASAPAVALRADIDALPITEQTGLPHASTAPGKMHACGHDGHTTILLGAASILARLPHRPNPVTFLFQPAEEGGGGADRLCREGALSGTLIGPRVGRVFGLHGWPELPVGTVASKPGPMMASTDEFRVLIRGVQSHGAYPHYSRDTILAAAHCITALQSIVSRNVGPLDSAVVTVGKINAGVATNVIPENAEFIGTLRTLTDATRAMGRERIKTVCELTAAALGCSAEVTLTEGYPVTRNDPALTDRWFALAREALGDARVATVPSPTMGGEDFAFYGRHAPAVFFCLGLKGPDEAKHPTLHQPDFDFNDEAIPTGVELFCRLALAE